MMKSIVSVSILILFHMVVFGAEFSLASTSYFPVEIQSTRYVTVAKAHAVQKENGLEISGTITRRGEVQ